MGKKKIAIIACLVGFVTTFAGFALPMVLSKFFAHEESNVIIQLMQSPTIKFVVGGFFLGVLVVGVRVYISSADDIEKHSY